MLGTLWNFSYTLKSQRWIPTETKWDWTVRMVSWAGTWSQRVLHLWLSSLGWPKRSFTVFANQAIILNREALDSNKLQALSSVTMTTMLHSDGWYWLTDRLLVSWLCPQPAKVIYIHMELRSLAPSSWIYPDFDFLPLSLKPASAQYEGDNDVKITPRATLSCLSPKWCGKEKMGFGHRPWFNPWINYLLIVSFWASGWNHLSLELLISKMGKTVPAVEWSVHIKWDNAWKIFAQHIMWMFHLFHSFHLSL